jgi:hypothetical protein
VTILKRKSERLTASDRMPSLDEVTRFVSSNPKTAINLVLDLVLAGHVTYERWDEDILASSSSDGRLRMLWFQCGGLVDKQGRAFIEINLLPRVLRLIIEADTLCVTTG